MAKTTSCDVKSSITVDTKSDTSGKVGKAHNSDTTRDSKSGITHTITWLSEEDYEKAIGQFRLQVGAVLSPFNKYGMDIYVSGAITEIVKLAEDFSLRVRGVDKPISLERIRGKRNARKEKD